MKHALIGNRQVLALISPEASVEWLCMPRFDSPSVFAAVLDDAVGGAWSFDTDAGADWRSAYVEDTNVLRTLVETEGGIFSIVDFCPLGGLGEAPAELVRVIRRLSGKPRVSMRFEPRLDYGRSEATPGIVAGSVRVGAHLRLTTNAPLDGLLEGRALDLGEPVVFVLSWGAPETRATLGACQRALAATIEGWRHWLHQILRRAPESARRSALCLKLHTFGPTGAIIAATTTSIPEALGTPRTWDYRYAWIRDGAFAAEAWPVLFEPLPPMLPDLEGGPRLPPCKAEGYTLVLDLDETLVHCHELDGLGGYYIRPGMHEFLERMSAQGYELVIFTAATQDYADWVIDQIDPTRLIRHRLYRQHALPWGGPSS